MTFQDKLNELVNQLLRGTTGGAIKWSETADENSFRAVLDRGLVRVERARAEGEPNSSEDYDYVYGLVVFDDHDKELARHAPHGPPQGDTVRELWVLASRSARNAEQKLDVLLQEVASKVGK